MAILMRQLTAIQCVRLYKSGITNGWSYAQKAKLQLFQKKMFLEDDHALAVIQNTLGRIVTMDEINFRTEALQKEYLSIEGNTAPTWKEYAKIIPADMQWMVGITKAELR